MYTVKPTSQFKKDLKLAQKRGYNIQDITDIIKNLLPEKLFQKRTMIIL